MITVARAGLELHSQRGSVRSPLGTAGRAGRRGTCSASVLPSKEQSSVLPKRGLVQIRKSVLGLMDKGLDIYGGQQV